ncbi:MAG TPA: ABC transporter permease [Candidatus Magasanikbacteria bacterium]|nr:ABC transporter permease [Candidatus Magasanikbacteria bacterium]
MKTKDLFHEIYEALSTNKVRSSLTILGIVIGISSVIAMVAIGQGAKSSIESSIQSIGSNLITVSPGTQRGAGVQVSSGRGSARTLTSDDSEAIETEVEGVAAVAPELSGRYQVTTKGKNTNTSVVGVNESYLEVKNITIQEGSFLTEQHLKTNAKITVLGPTTRDDLFGEGAAAVGQTVRINKIEFKVIGITASKGGTGFNNPDDQIYIPLTTAQRFLAGEEYVSSIAVQATDSEAMATVQEGITSLLLQRHKISDPASADFSTINQADIVATASSVTETFTTLLAAVAGISLVVGGIGIMNMMLTNVTERTREIGLRKAIGAKYHDINLQFLSESVVLTFLGGVIGTFVGWIISVALTYFGVIQTKVSLSSIFLAFGVSAAIGIIFGYYPAKRASKLNPIQALRYE